MSKLGTLISDTQDYVDSANSTANKMVSELNTVQNLLSAAQDYMSDVEAGIKSEDIGDIESAATNLRDKIDEAVEELE